MDESILQEGKNKPVSNEPYLKGNNICVVYHYFHSISSLEALRVLHVIVSDCLMSRLYT